VIVSTIGPKARDSRHPPAASHPHDGFSFQKPERCPAVWPPEAYNPTEGINAHLYHAPTLDERRHQAHEGQSIPVGRLSEELSSRRRDLKDFYMVTGQYDVVVITEAPDDITLAKAMLSIRGEAHGSQ
jgi:hypothetical protein